MTKHPVLIFEDYSGKLKDAFINDCGYKQKGG